MISGHSQSTSSEPSSHQSFDDLVDLGAAAPVEGWDFSFLRGRIDEQRLPWSYPDLARPLLARARLVLDVDTGGGEMFSALRPPGQHGRRAAPPVMSTSGLVGWNPLVSA